MGHGAITKSVPKIRPVHVRPAASVPEGLYTPAQPVRPVAQPVRPVTQPVRESTPRPPSPEPVRAVEEPIPAPPMPPAFPQRAQKRASARPQRPLPQAFEPEPVRRVDYELSPRQFNDVDPITSGIRVRRSARRRGNARH